jgi:hypothetical protein
VVHICEPETGKSLSDDEDKRSVDDLKDCQKGNNELSNCQVGNDMRLAEDFINCQEGRNGLSSCQVGNGKRSMGGIIYCQRSSNESSNCQVGNEMGSLEDLIDFQESRRKIPSCQVGKGSERRLFESLMNSAESSYQQGELVEVDQRSILIIGGIEIFLPSSLVGARACVAGAATEGQPSRDYQRGERTDIDVYPNRKRGEFR